MPKTWVHPYIDREKLLGLDFTIQQRLPQFSELVIRVLLNVKQNNNLRILFKVITFETLPTTFYLLTGTEDNFTEHECIIKDENIFIGEKAVTPNIFQDLMCWFWNNVITPEFGTPSPTVFDPEKCLADIQRRITKELQDVMLKPYYQRSKWLSRFSFKYLVHSTHSHSAKDMIDSQGVTLKGYPKIFKNKTLHCLPERKYIWMGIIPEQLPQDEYRSDAWLPNGSRYGPITFKFEFNTVLKKMKEKFQTNLYYFSLGVRMYKKEVSQIVLVTANPQIYRYALPLININVDSGLLPFYRDQKGVLWWICREPTRDQWQHLEFVFDSEELVFSHEQVEIYANEHNTLCVPTWKQKGGDFQGGRVGCKESRQTNHWKNVIQQYKKKNQSSHVDMIDLS